MVAQATYQDLLRLHLEQKASEFVGTIEERPRGERVYLYDKFRLGGEMQSRYIGEATPELRARLKRAAQLKAAEKARRSDMSRLAGILRAEGFNRTDRDTGSLLSAFSKVGLFRLGGTLIGTGAFGLYQGDLGVKFSLDDLVQTGDIDFASFEKLSMSLGDRVEENPDVILKGMKFEPVPGIVDRQVWRWRQKSGAAMVEFLTPAFGDESVKPLRALGVSAQGLNYLNFLLADPIPAVALYRSGVLVQIPRPERYAIHKLIVADRRRADSQQGKSRKDRAQAEFLISVLAQDRPDDLLAAYETARSQGSRWGERIDASLRLAPKAAKILASL
jgi:hypothetical protein